MSSPNVILMAVLTPSEEPKKTLTRIYESLGIDNVEEWVSVNSSLELKSIIMRYDYNEDWQIAAKDGDLVFFNFMTYGYGDVVSLSDFTDKVKDLEEWAKDISERHDCSYEISITANYW